MNFLLPVFKNDLLRLRGLLICWGVLLCVQSFLGIGGTDIAANNLKLQMLLPELALFIVFLQGLMLIILIPLFIQTDPLVGTTAFWFTRPIGRKQLLVTKLCFAAGILLFMLLLAEVIVFAANGFHLKYIVLSIPEILIEKSAFITMFLLLAVITPKFSRYAIVGVSILAVFITISIVWSILSTFMPETMDISKRLADADVVRAHTLDLSVGVVANIFIILFGSGVVVYQYLCRNTKKTVLLIVAGVVLLTVLYQVWGFDFLKVDIPKTESNLTADTVTLTVDTNFISMDDVVRYSTDSDREKEFMASVDISSPSSTEFVVLTDLRSKIEYPENNTLDSSYLYPGYSDSIDNVRMMEYLQAAMMQSKIVNPFVDSEDDKNVQRHRRIFACDEKSLSRYKDKPGIYRADVEFDSYKYKVNFAIPLKLASRDKFGAQQIKIFDILTMGNGISVVVVEKKVTLLFDRQRESSNLYENFLNRSFPKTIYLIENAKRGEAFVAEDLDDFPDFGDIMNASSRLSTKIKKFEFLDVNFRNGQLPKIDSEWLKDAQLVRVDAVRTGHLTKQLELKDFVLPSKSIVPEDEPVQ